jgi:hypothetical protein
MEKHPDVAGALMLAALTPEDRAKVLAKPGGEAKLVETMAVVLRTVGAQMPMLLRDVAFEVEKPQ